MPRLKILFLAHLLPWPLEGGGQIKSYHTLRILAEQYDIAMVALIRRPEEEKYLSYLMPFCTEGITCYLLKRSCSETIRHAFLAFSRNRSFLVSRDYVPRIDWHDSQKRAFHEYAAIHVDHLQMAQYVPEIVQSARAGQPKIILDQHNVEHRIVQRLAGTSPRNPFLRLLARIESRKLRDFEIAAMRRADATLAVSEEDRTVFLKIAPDLSRKVTTVPIGVDAEYFAVAERRRDAGELLSIGTMSWLPNIDALRWFVSEILPLVRQEKPDIVLRIVGANPAADIVALAKQDSQITVTGTVPDVRPYASECGVFIVPLRAGSGVRVKILNALAMGLPVVSTTLGAEGIAITHGKHLLTADTPRAFADAILFLLRNPEQATILANNGRTLMETTYSWNVVGRQLHRVYQRILGDG